jgi:hypothetical protein
MDNDIEAAAATDSPPDDPPVVGSPPRRKNVPAEELWAVAFMVCVAVLALWVLQRESLSWWLRVPGGILATWMFIVALVGVGADKLSDELAGLAFVSVFVIVIGVGIASGQGFWANVPTSGHSHSDQTSGDDSGGDTTYTPPDTSGGGNVRSSPDGGANDPTITNIYWYPCKSQLGYGGIYDSNLTDAQYVQVMACAMNDDITNAENTGG